MGESQVSRDLEAARDAYTTGDAGASRAAHNRSGAKRTPAPAPAFSDPRASEAHQAEGGRVKAIVFGGCAGRPCPHRRAAPTRAHSCARPRPSPFRRALLRSDAAAAPSPEGLTAS